MPEWQNIMKSDGLLLFFGLLELFSTLRGELLEWLGLPPQTVPKLVCT